MRAVLRAALEDFTHFSSGQLFVWPRASAVFGCKALERCWLRTDDCTFNNRGNLWCNYIKDAITTHFLINNTSAEHFATAANSLLWFRNKCFRTCTTTLLLRIQEICYCILYGIWLSAIKMNIEKTEHCLWCIFLAFVKHLFTRFANSQNASIHERAANPGN